MNFITRNLGWLLLFGFFIFMLFIISSNNSVQENKQSETQTGNIFTSTGEKNLDDLIEKISNTETNITEEETLFAEDKVQEIDTNNENDNSNFESEVILESSGSADTSVDLSFFEKIFGKKGVGENTGDVEKDDIVLGGTGMLENTGSVDEEIYVKNTITVPATSQTLQGENLMKDVNITVNTQKIESKIPSLYSPYGEKNISEIFPGTNLETYVGKEYQIGVYSLKLNNKNFNQTLAYMMKGEKIKQISPENSYACFEIEIITSYKAENIGKTGYVCKKYLEDISSAETKTTHKLTQEKESVEQIIPLEQRTKIGDIINITKPNTVFGNNIQLALGDSIDQMTDMDEKGCFMAHVYNTSIISSFGKVGKICISDIY